VHVEKSINKQFGGHIRMLRLERKLTQEELAGQSKISLKYIQRIEGKNPPNVGIESVQKLARGLELDIWKLLKF
jgi:transcriptional regulator with XRE-family HTH domain